MDSSEKIKLLSQAAKELNIKPLDLITVVYIESRLNENAYNASTKATGIIQWIPKTAISLHGLTVQQIQAMNFSEQVELMKEYILKNKGEGLSGTDLYLTIFYPISRGKENYVYPNSVYIVNQGLDYDKNGTLTYSDINNFFEYKKNEVLSKYGNEIPQEVNFFSLKNMAIFLGAILIIFLIWKLSKTKTKIQTSDYLIA